MNPETADKPERRVPNSVRYERSRDRILSPQSLILSQRRNCDRKIASTSTTVTGGLRQHAPSKDVPQKPLEYVSDLVQARIRAQRLTFGVRRLPGGGSLPRQGVVVEELVPSLGGSLGCHGNFAWISRTGTPGDGQKACVCTYFSAPISGLIYRALLRYYRCDTPYRVIPSQEG